MKQIKEYIKKNRKIIILLSITFILFLTLGILVAMNKTNYFDSLVHSYILNLRNDNLNSFFSIITNFAGASFLLAISVLLLVIMKKKKIPLYMLINLVSAFIINEVIKSMFMRTRPIGINLIDETGFSFPSGHSMVALSFYGFIAYLLCKNTDNKFKKLIINSSLILVALLIGFSRIYLGVHYLTDVIGGFLLSIIYLTIYINIINIEKK